MSYSPNPGQLKARQLLRGPQRHTKLVGGSRSGKTTELVRAIVVRALHASDSRHAILRFRANAARSSISLDTLPKVVSMVAPGVKLTEHRQDGFFGLPNKSQIWVGGLDDKERTEKILGQEFATIFFNECSQIPYGSVTTALTRLAQRTKLRQRAYYDLNPSGSMHWSNLLFGKHVDPLSRKPLNDPENYKRCFLNPAQNAGHLSPEYLASLQNLPEKQRRRFFEGVYVDEVDGALWTYDQLESVRIDCEGLLTRERCAAICAAHNITQVVVAADPSGASGKEEERSDEIGIGVVGRSAEGKGYILEDCSIKAGPEVWGPKTVDAYKRWQANRIVGERNFGGAMVEFVIKAADKRVPVKLVTASKGKHVRAEPISVLFDGDDPQMRIIGRWPELEDQLVNFSSAGYMGDRSPDRADAMIWAASDLMLTDTKLFGALLSEATRAKYGAAA